MSAPEGSSIFSSRSRKRSPPSSATPTRTLPSSRSFERFLDTQVVRVADFPALKEIAWNLHDDFLPARLAFALYERNWKYIDHAHMDARERDFLAALTDRFGAGIINA
ncbi:MAG: hypothetical protein QM765_33235 [Myxococcales bacterium]